MKFDDLDAAMRVFETAHDHLVLPGIHIVARLDGRSFTRLTKEREQFEAPFDERFRDLMLATTRHLMQVGFKVLYGYTESDEISLLFDLSDDGFGRKLRKINSILAGEASAVFSLGLGSPGVFDCRVCQLPTRQNVVEYFRWRQEDAHRNALNAHCYWRLRTEGLDANVATDRISGLSVAEKNELLFQRGTNFNELPGWQKRGIGVYWETYEKEGFNPKTEQTVRVPRRRLRDELDLPFGKDYERFVGELL
ncbi:MAG: tRNA(His) guanylyltransferase Thg1 family protein [Acidobacteriota bacterium]